MSNNKLRKIFCPDEEDIREEQEFIKRIKTELVESKHCCTCANSVEVPHIEMGYDAGTDPYCNILNELRYGCNGQQCLWYEVKEEYKQYANDDIKQ